MRVQRYICANCRSFSPIHSSVEDDRRYPRAVTQLATVVDALADSSLENRQDLFTIHYDVRSSSQQIHNWCTEQTAEIVANDFSVYSSIYTHDRQYLTIDGHRAYRLTVYMSYFVHQSTMDSATGGPKRPSVSFSPPSLPRNQFTSSQPTGDQTTQTSSKTISTLHTTTVASTSSKTANRSFRTLFSRVFATRIQSDFAELSSGASSSVSSLHSPTEPQSAGSRRCSTKSSIFPKNYAHPSKT